MKNIRIIARLDIKGPNLVKGIHLEGLRVLGNPVDFAKHYYENGADEIIYQDVVASLYERNGLFDFVSKVSKEIFIPMTIGGGIRTTDDIQKMLRAGADKVSINTAAIKNPNFIRDSANKFGSSTIVVAIEAIKHNDGKYYAYCDNGREATELEVFAWAKQAQELGAGEILLTSVDREGTGRGFDIELTKKISHLLNIPVIAHGGAGKTDDIVEVIKKGNADAVALAGILHYRTMQKYSDLETPKSEGNLEFAQSKRSVSYINDAEIRAIKEQLIASKIETRLDFGSPVA